MSTALVVEDDAALREELCAWLTAFGMKAEGGGTLAEGRQWLARARFDLVLLDVCLPDGRALDFLRHLGEESTLPTLIAMSGQADPVDAFSLAEQGVRAFLQKPFDIAELKQALEAASSSAPSVRPQLRASVGMVNLTDVESQVRQAMVREALARANGNRRGAARLLGVSRQFLQHVLRRMDDEL